MSYGRDDKLCRQALDWLLAQYPDRPVPSIDTQEPTPTNHIGGPWLCVDFSPGERFAIWKTTGCVHRLQAEGAVEDDPIFDPAREPERTVVKIARCPIHGLHGSRHTCFTCGGPVEQVPMVRA